jgi:hypothetical protein
MPMPMNNSKGSNFPMTSATPVRAADLTPMTLINVNTPNEPTITTLRATPSAAAGQKRATASARPLLNAAAEAMRVSQTIQPISKPTNGPKASRAYK